MIKAQVQVIRCACWGSTCHCNSAAGTAVLGVVTACAWGPGADAALQPAAGSKLLGCTAAAVGPSRTPLLPGAAAAAATAAAGLVAAALASNKYCPPCPTCACRDRPQLPFRCLDGQYRRELVRVYLTNVEGIARRFVDEKREYLQVGRWLLLVQLALLLAAALGTVRLLLSPRQGGASTSGSVGLLVVAIAAGAAAAAFQLPSRPSRSPLMLHPRFAPASSDPQRLLAEGRGFKAYWRGLPAERQAALAEEPAAAVLKVGAFGRWERHEQPCCRTCCRCCCWGCQRRCRRCGCGSHCCISSAACGQLQQVGLPG